MKVKIIAILILAISLTASGLERVGVTKNVGNIVGVGLCKWNSNQYIKVTLSTSAALDPGIWTCGSVLILWSDNDLKNAVIWSSLQKAVNDPEMYLEVNRWEDIGSCLTEVRDFSVRK